MFNVHRNNKAYYERGEVGGGGMEVGGGGGGRGEEGDYIYRHRYTVTTRMTSALRWAAMRDILISFIIARDKVTRQCPQITTFEVKGEPKQIRTEVPLLTSLPPDQTSSQG